MKQIQGSVRVKIKEYVHAWSEFVFVSLLVRPLMKAEAESFGLLEDDSLLCKLYIYIYICFESRKNDTKASTKRHE